MSRLRRRWLARVALFAAFAVSADANAQTATPLDRYEPAPSGDELLGTPSAAVTSHLRPSAGALLSFAKSPLVLVDANGEEVGDVVDYQLVLHNLVSLELWLRLKLELDVPVTLAQTGDAPQLGNVQSVSPSGAAMNDVRVGMRVELLKQNGYWPSAALAASAWIPTGDDDSYASSGQLRFAPALVIGGNYDELVWSVNVARRFDVAGASDDGLLGSELQFGAGLGPRIGPVTLTAEIFGSTVAQSNRDLFAQATTNLEAHIGARYDLGPVSFRAAGGPGLTPGAGTPDYRIVGFIGYVPEADASSQADADHDDVARHPSDASGGAATAGAGREGVAVAAGAADRDGDGVPDATDACPDRLGDPAAKRLGCPADGDGDGVSNADDACPDKPGVRSSDAARDGCPGDSDGDGITDDADACVREKGAASDDPKANGCPTSVRVVGEQIVILQQVSFATGRAEIAETSHALLTQVVQVLQEHSEIVRVAIEGHTDNVGDEKANILLSQKRALAVMRWLIDHGVDERRLESRGYGPRRPIQDNGTDEGRTKNRRVDFQILKRSDRRRDAWTDGAVDDERAAPGSKGGSQ